MAHQAEKEHSPEEQRQRLLDSIKNDNQEIAGMEHKMEEVRVAALEEGVGWGVTDCRIQVQLSASSPSPAWHV